MKHWLYASLGIKYIFRALVALSFVLISTGVGAQSETSTLEGPHKVIADTTSEVFRLLEGGVDPVLAPGQFVESLSQVLDPVVAFEYIAKGVMGVYGKNASPAQVKLFAESFKRGLVNTYGRGVSGFQGLDVKVLAPNKPIGNSRRANVIQEIRSPGGVNKVSYSMAKNRQGQWKLVNLILNGVNLGQTFRGQFAAAVENNNGDIDQTISDWGRSVGSL